MKHVEVPFWTRWSAAMRAVNPDVELLGEVLDGDAATVAQTWRNGGFTSMFDFPLAFAMSDVFCKGAPATKLAVALSHDRRYPDAARLVTLLDNHDLPRVMSACGGEQAKVMAALAFLFTARGVPSIIWGTEVGLEGAKEPENRASMRFAEHPLRAEIAFWLEARRVHPALSEGAQAIDALGPAGVRFVRVTPDQLALVAVGSVELEAPAGVPMRALVAPSGRGDVRVLVSDVAPGRFRARYEAAFAAQRGLELVDVRFEGPPGVSIAGSAPELGDWRPERAVALPATVKLPRGAVIEFKAVQVARGTVTWAQGPNVLVHVTAPAVVRVPSR